MKSVHAVHDKNDNAVVERTEQREEKIVEDTASSEREEPVVVKQNKVSAKVKVAANKKSSFIYHVVQPGDTLWNIAKRYDGVTVEMIKDINNLHNANIKPGTRLKVIVNG